MTKENDLYMAGRSQACGCILAHMRNPQHKHKALIAIWFRSWRDIRALPEITDAKGMEGESKCYLGPRCIKRGGNASLSPIEVKQFLSLFDARATEIYTLFDVMKALDD